ncbi:hypothetical protein I3760_13G017600 [Carya illinoinensis]|nr:hypothetical protein I3760_13G017600 [Carya illinoinensis]KAG2671998.1 hypothetical protein I3760_13G017600 [Carya illinoinensis]
MGGSEKHAKSKQNPQSKKLSNDNDEENHHPPETETTEPDSELVQAEYYPTPRKCDQNPGLGQTSSNGDSSKNNDTSNVNLKPSVSTDFDMKNLKYYSEQQLEELLRKKLEMIYNEAYVRLICHGYSHDVVLKAILTNGHGFGDMDIVTNIVQNSLNYIKTGFVLDDGTYKQGQQVFGDMKMLVKNSLAVMIYLLRQVRPNLIKRDAMRCLLMSNFHLGLSSTMKVPFSTDECEGQVAEDDSLVNASPEVCEVQSNKLSGDGQSDDLGKNGPSENLGFWLDRKFNVVKSLKHTPSLEARLKINIETFAAACRATVKMSPKMQATEASLPRKKSTEPLEWEDSCMVKLILGGFGDLRLNEQSEIESLDPKIEIISSLVQNIKDIKQQVKDRKEWAQKKVVQAAKKLSHDLSEIKMLRIENGGERQAKNDGEEVNKEALKKLVQLENALRRAGCQADLAKLANRNISAKNAEIRAEVEAFKLSASESDKMCMEVGSRENKCLKKILAMEKQNNKYREEIEGEKKKSSHLHQQLLDLKKAQEETEVMWRQEVKAKELAIAHVKEEQRLKKEVEVDIKRKHGALRQKMDLDYQRCKDDKQQLEQEISSLQLSLDSSNPNHLQDVSIMKESEHARPEEDTVEVMLPDLSELLNFSEEEIIHDRICLICMENEVSVVFLPCAHQVLCANCTENHCKNAEAKCPCCQGPIAQTIRVYGTSF